ncbi:MAG: peroxiredoxin-like family protein [Acidobacteriota bacterium]|nr:peroxiredoxin-like family protein [Acidobacteriota bacterium]
MPDTLDLPADSPLRNLADDPVLVVLLRSFGCTFCREAVADVAKVKPQLDAAGVRVAFVHGGSPEEAEPYFAKYRLPDVVRISDPTLAHYRAFGLGRTGPQALVDPVVWARGAVCALSHGFGPQPAGLMRQLPGVFVVQHGGVLSEYRHRSPADRPDYLALVQGALRGATMA